MIKFNDLPTRLQFLLFAIGFALFITFDTILVADPVTEPHYDVWVFGPLLFAAVCSVLAFRIYNRFFDASLQQEVFEAEVKISAVELAYAGSTPAARRAIGLESFAAMCGEVPQPADPSDRAFVKLVEAVQDAREASLRR